MGLFFRRKRFKKPTPAWMIWTTIGFLVYSAITNGNKENITVIKPSNDAQNTKDKEETLSLGSIFNPDKIVNMSALNGKYLPSTTMKLNAIDNNLGEGMIALCGQKVTINYRSFIEDENEKYKKEITYQQNVAFQIGEDETIPALEKGVMGMKRNGTRTIFSPGTLAYGAKGFTRDDVPALADIRFETELLDISPKLPDFSAFRVIGDRSINNKISICGSTVKLHVAIWNVEGKRLFYTGENKGEPITFTIGKSEVFLGLEQGSLGMTAGMHRNLIVPPSMQKTLHGNDPIVKFPFPERQTVLVDIEYMP